MLVLIFNLRLLVGSLVFRVNFIMLFKLYVIAANNENNNDNNRRLIVTSRILMDLTRSKSGTARGGIFTGCFLNGDT